MICAGKASEILWSRGRWLILDIGFSNDSKSCGIVFGEAKPKKLRFSEALEEVNKAAQEKGILNLVVEAPLSVAFDKAGNPKGRAIEREDGKNRYWYVGPGCVVMVAGLYLLRSLYASTPKADLKLFEGCLSYKTKGSKSDHEGDVERLRNAIKNSRTPNPYVIDPEFLKTDPQDTLKSAFEIMNIKGMNFGIPPVIKITG